MLVLCLQSLARYMKWWVGALRPGANPQAPLSWRRILFLLLCPALLALQILHWLGLFLDELLFPAYRRTAIRKPVFITGIPRSGTTYVHRCLAHDSNQFISVSTWEAVLAPSITARKILRLLIRLDQKIGSPIKKCITASTQRAAGDFNKIHAVAPDAPEEDYLWLLPASSCLILLLAFPNSHYLAQMAALDTLPAHQRNRLLDFYEACIRRHLYTCGNGRRFLSKNAAFASWCPALRQRFPDAKFILCVREPTEALRSQLSSLAPARRLFGTDPSGEMTARLFGTCFQHNYELLVKFIESAPPENTALIDQADLRAAPGPLLQTALSKLDIQPGTKLREYLKQQQARHQSQHAHQPAPSNHKISKIGVYLQPIHRTLLSKPVRVQPSTASND